MSLQNRVALHTVAVIFGALVILALSHDTRFLIAQLNADELWPSSFAWDAFHHSYAWQGFKLPPSPNFVPDLALVGMLQAAFGSWRWALFALAIAHFVAFGYVGGWLVTSISNLALPIAALFVEAVSGALVVLCTIVPPALAGGPPFFGELFPVATLYLGAAHCGAYLGALGLTGFILWSLNRPLRPLGALLAAVVTFALVLSDREMVVVFVVPIIVVLSVAIARVERGSATAFMLGFLVAAGTAFALGVLPRLNGVADLPMPSLGHALEHIRNFAEGSASFARGHPLQVGGTLALALGFLAFPLILLRRQQPPLQRESGWILWAFCALSIIGALVMTTALYQDEDSYRYLEPALFTMVVIGVAGLALLWRAAPVALASLAALVAATSAIPVMRAGTLLPGAVTWRPYQASCIEPLRHRFALEAGLADYWAARPLTLFYDEALQVGEVFADGTPRYFENNVVWFTHSFRDPARPPAYRFILTWGLDEPALQRRYGKPDRISRCGLVRTWIYDDPNRLNRIVAAALQHP